MLGNPTQILLPIGLGMVTTTAHLEVRRPWDGSQLARVALGNAELLDRAITAANAALAKTRRQSPHERAAVLLKIAALIAERKELLAETICAEGGKPITLAEAEVDRAVATFTAAADAARTFGREALAADAYPTGAGHTAELLRVPIGVVYGMGPFNFPLNLVAHKIAPAIAAGATIVLKPSPRTPISAIRLAEICREAGVIEGQVNVVTCDNADALKPLKDDRVKLVSFTGSAAIGWQIKKAAGKQKVLLELGGNAAAIVHADADISTAAPLLATGAFANAGQSCISVQRVYVHASVYDAFKKILLDHVRDKVNTGDPSRRDVLNGPMIDAASRDRALAAIESAKQAGATVLTGGQIEGPCLLPTVLENVPADHALVAEEAFAPILVLARYNAFDDAIAAVNTTRYGLQAGVFTRDAALARQAVHELDVGGVLINQSPTFRLDHLPYGGIKDSGLGREGLRWAMEEMTEPKLVLTKTS